MMFILERIKYLFLWKNLSWIVLVFCSSFIFAVIFTLTETKAKFKLRNCLGAAFLMALAFIVIVHVFIAPLYVQKNAIIDTKRYEIVSGGNYTLLAIDEDELVLTLENESEWKFPAERFRIEVRTDIDASFLEVSTELMEQIYLHKTVYDKQETYTLYIKSGE